MALTLPDCFEYAGIDITELDGNTFNEVKKILLLELKSSGEDTLLIAGERYSKNDILQFFEQGDANQEEITVTSEDRIPALKENGAEWHHVLAKPEALTGFFELPDELLDRDALNAAKELVERQYGKAILREAQRQFRDEEYERLQYLLSYAPVFSSAFSYELKQSLLQLLKNQLLKMEHDSREELPVADFRALPFFNKSYYSTTHFLKDMDSDLARQVMRTAVDRCRGQQLSWKLKRELFQLFYLLPMNPEMEEYIKKNIAYFDERIAEEEQKQASGYTTTEGKSPLAPTELLRRAATVPASANTIPKLIGRAVVLILFLLGCYLLYDRFYGESAAAELKKKAESARELVLFEEELKGSYYDQEEVIKDYKKLRAAIEENVTHPLVRGFLVNELSQYAYEMNVDSISRIYFIPIKPIPESVPLKFDNGSELSDVLVLVYDEVHPDAPVKGRLIPKNKDYNDEVLYILPTERVIVLFNPVIENGETVVASKPESIDEFNVLYESYRLKSGTPKKEVYLSTSEYESGQVSITHIYETMNFKRLSRAD